METPLVPTGLQAPPRRSDVPLAPLTTLELGGAARWLVEAGSEGEVLEALAWARGTGTPVAVLGGGSNVVVADAGFDGLVVRVALRGVSASCAGPGEPVLLTAAAGESWDEVVARAVAEGWAGVECLSGIPGTVGATPVQNVGAYGQEVADTAVSVRVLDTGSSGGALRDGSLREPPQGCGASVASGDAERATVGVVRDMAAAECGFGYRDSIFRRSPGRFVVLAATLALRPGGPAAVRYAELARALGDPASPPPLGAVREAVLSLRRAKSMVVDPADPNRRSVGSFFVNPVVSEAEADAVVRRALASGAAPDAAAVPRHGAGTGRVKLSAAWLIERAGFPRGTRRGSVGISTHHTLALVHHGGGTAAELVALAREVQCGVDARFGVLLRPEPVFLGFPDADPVTGRCGSRTRCR